MPGVKESCIRALPVTVVDDYSILTNCFQISPSDVRQFRLACGANWAN